MLKTLLAFTMTAVVAFNVCGYIPAQMEKDSKVAAQSPVSEDSEAENATEQIATATKQAVNATKQKAKGSWQLTYPFITQNCMYRLNHSGNKLIQMDLHGKEIKKYDIPTDWSHDYLRVSDHYICYNGTDRSIDIDRTTLYVAPIRQTKNGEEIIWEEKEKILEMTYKDKGDLDEVTLIEPYLIYTTDKVYCYNLNTKETLPLEPTEKFGFRDGYFHENFWEFTSVYDGMIYRQVFDDKKHESLYQIDLKTWKARKLFSYNDKGCVLPKLIAVKNHLVCMEMDSEMNLSSKAGSKCKIACFDTKKNTKTRLTGKKISAVLEKEHLWGTDIKKRKCYVDASFSYGNRIYLKLNLSWFKKGMVKIDGKKGSLEVTRTILVSFPWNDITDVSYEREISEWWYNRAKRVTSWVDDDYIQRESLGNIITLYNDELYMTYSDQKGHDHMAAYHMGKKKYRKVNKKETAYQLMIGSKWY